MIKFKGFANKQQMYLVFKNRNIDYKYIRFKDNDGNIDYAYLWMPNAFWYSQDVVGNLISRDFSKMNRNDIDLIKRECGFIEISNDGILYEVDTYPIFKDFIKFPITEVEVLDEEDVIRYKIENFIK